VGRGARAPAGARGRRRAGHRPVTARPRRGRDGATGVRVRVDAGDPLDDVVLRSYATGAPTWRCRG
jgi:hypothetical protein